ncbi:IucA/IucC family C-terminal-domain containing protein [Salinibacillus xinjiangensis]|uniref:Aerobactin siderophore biosynthesis IucA/IucC-like C-terminal domain-containing protein n=1 Tax=Salinibacillus xinjiangensis TaxID=1229268 RepID=A0A6G1X2P1_9BACI|nr:IucA/IucC family C-terminal-domain containing protein [Salinibacillus xinjiangensis]MRG85214.1 hypothetical protein [Salinibacillus xinjiangensis]
MDTLKPHEEQLMATHFRYDYERSFQAVHKFEHMSASQLVNPEFMSTLFSHLKQYLHSDSLLAVASTFVKRYSYLVVTTGFCSLSVFNKQLDFSLNNIHLVLTDDDSRWFPSLRIDDISTITNADPNNRYEWLQAASQELVHNHLLKVFETVHQVTKLPFPVMWESFATYFFWFYERYATKLVQEDSILTTMENDFHMIVHEFHGKMFGEKENPLHKFSYQLVLPTKARVRKTCCLTHMLNNESTYCKVCPHVCK